MYVIYNYAPHNLFITNNLKYTIMTYKEWVKEMCGYETFTTFWDDFTMVEHNLQYLIGTFNLAFNAYKNDYKYLTELVMVLNHKANLYAQKGYEGLARIYLSFYNKADEWAYKNLKGKEAEYYFRTLD